MSIARSRTAAFRALILVTLLVPVGPRALAGSALVDRFTPETGGFPLYSRAPVVPHPSGGLFFALVANRLLCTVDGKTGTYRSSIDLGLDAFEQLERQPIAPMTISPDGTVIALAAAGAVRFFDVAADGKLSVRSTYPAPTGAAAAVGLSVDGTLAIFASGPAPTTVSSVRTRDAKLVDDVLLSDDEAPIHSEYSPERMALSVVTRQAVLMFRHDEHGKLKQTGQYERDGFVGDAYSGIEALGKRGRVIYTVEVGGSAVIGLSLKGKQTSRAAVGGTERFSEPVATAVDGSRIALVAVNAQTGAETSIVFFRGEGRNIKGDGNAFALDPALGPIGQLVFDPMALYLAVSFPASGTVLLLDAVTKQVLGGSTSIGSADGLVWSPNGKLLYVSGQHVAGVVGILPVSARGFDETERATFESLPGAIFGPGDRAFAFANRFFAIATSSAAGALWSFNASSGSIVQRVDLGRSTGVMAIAPDGRTIVASGGGGLRVFTIDDAGHFTEVGEGTPGAAPPGEAPSIAFHPSLHLAYVTSGVDVWRVDLDSGGAERFAIGAEDATLTNPAASVVGNRLYLVEEGRVLVRCSLDSSGRPTVSDRKDLDVTLDARAPRVAYDAAATHLWATSGAVVRQYNLVTGREDGASAPGDVGTAVVLVAPDLIAMLANGNGSVSFFTVGNGAPVLSGTAALPDAYLGGEPAVDAQLRRVFVPCARSVVSVASDGNVVTLDDAASTRHLSFATTLSGIAYADFARFPGSVAVAKGF